jgi:hypothetical protein
MANYLFAIRHWSGSVKLGCYLYVYDIPDENDVKQGNCYCLEVYYEFWLTHDPWLYNEVHSSAHVDIV